MSALSNECRRKAETQGLVSLMNDTKWRELCFAFVAFEKKPAWRTRDLLNGYLSDWDCDWFHHVGPDYCSIEWLEIDPRDCGDESIASVLRQVGVPFEESEDYFRVIGYRKAK
jgi:hypothetical protein